MDVIVDSNMTFDEAIKGTSAPKNILDDMVLVNVKYYSVDNKIHQGQLMVNRYIEKDITEIFDEMLKLKFTINKCVPMSAYNWNDDASMEDNNSSAFCYRVIAGTDRISKHSFGCAIDINPMFNPLIKKNGESLPLTGSYDINRSGTLVDGSEVVEAFLEREFIWGKYFSSYADIHHFEKTLK